MVIDPVSLSAEHQAEAWLEDLLGEAEPRRGRGPGGRQPGRVPAPPGGGRSPRARGHGRPGHRRPRRLGRGRAARRRSLDAGAGAAAEGRDAPAPVRPPLPARAQRGAGAPGALRRAAGRTPASARVRGAGAASAGRPRLPGASRTRRSSCARRWRRASRSCARRGARTWSCASTSWSSSPAGCAREADRVLEAQQAAPEDEQGPQPDGELLAHALGRLEAALRARQQRV